MSLQVNKEIEMEMKIHRADYRGSADHGWLNSYHSFSFANYYDSEKMGFGLLRVLNDDQVRPGRGFGTHPHNNMEIVSIPLSGSLRHKDNQGNEKVIKQGEVQIMSAGTGVTHSEYNNSEEEDVSFLQIWVMPKELNVEPRYDQKTFPREERKNKFQTIVNPVGKSRGGVEINQDSYFSRVDLDKDKGINYEIHELGSGVYVFILDGEVSVGGEKLNKRDAVGISNVENFEIKAHKQSEVLLIEVPLEA